VTSLCNGREHSPTITNIEVYKKTLPGEASSMISSWRLCHGATAGCSLWLWGGLMVKIFLVSSNVLSTKKGGLWTCVPFGLWKVNYMLANLDSCLLYIFVVQSNAQRLLLATRLIWKDGHLWRKPEKKTIAVSGKLVTRVRSYKLVLMNLLILCESDL